MGILFLVKGKDFWRVLNRGVKQIASFLVLKDYPGATFREGKGREEKADRLRSSCSNLVRDEGGLSSGVSPGEGKKQGGGGVGFKSRANRTCWLVGCGKRERRQGDPQLFGPDHRKYRALLPRSDGCEWEDKEPILTHLVWDASETPPRRAVEKGITVERPRCAGGTQRIVNTWGNLFKPTGLEEMAEGMSIGEEKF